MKRFLALAAFLCVVSARADVTNKTDGLALPADSSLSADTDPFVVILADDGKGGDVKGSVKWLVVPNVPQLHPPIKVDQSPKDPNRITVSVPRGGYVDVFAVATIDGKLTDFVRTRITAKDAPLKGPPSANPTVPRLPAGTKLDVNVIVPNGGDVSTFKGLRDALPGHSSHVYREGDQAVAMRKLLDPGVVGRVQVPALVLLTSKGEFVQAFPLPRDAAGVKELVGQIVGK